MRYDESGNPVTGASVFMTYHTVLRNSSQFYESLRAARAIADNITRTLNLIEKDGKLVPSGETKYEVFPYRWVKFFLIECFILVIAFLFLRDTDSRKGTL